MPRALVITLSILVMIGAVPAPGVEPEPEAQIDGPAEVRPGFSPTFPDVAVDQAGQRVYVWNDFVSPNRLDVFVRRFDAGGNPLNDPLQVNTLVDDDQLSPRVAVAVNRSFLVVWQSEEPDTANPDVGRRWVRSQAFDATATPVGSEELLSSLSSAIATDIYADVAALRAGGYVVVWESANSSGSDTGVSIQGRLVSAAGVPLGGQFQVNSDDSGSQTKPSVTELGDGGFLVVWDGPELMGRRFSAAGVPAGPDFQISTAFSGQKLASDAAIGWDDQVAVVWADADAADDFREIRMRLFDAALTPQGDDFRVNTLIAGDQSDPRLAAFGRDGFLVVWTSTTSVGSDPDTSVQSRTVTGTNHFAGPQTQLNVFVNGAQQHAAAHGHSGWAATAWRSAGHSENTSETAILGRQIDTCLCRPSDGCFFCDDYEWGSTWRWSSTVD